MKKRNDNNTVVNNYKTLVKHGRMVPDWVLYLLIFLPPFFIGIYWNDSESIINNYAWWIGLISILSLYEHGKRYGHAEGYFEGHESGYEDGKNDALGIDKEMEETLHDIENEKMLGKILKKSKK